MLIGERIRHARNAANLTQAALAAHLGVTAATVGNWENGNNEPAGQNLENVLEWLETVETEQPSFGEWLLEKRLEKGYSRAKLSELSGINQGTIRNIETGVSANPQSATRMYLANALELDVPGDVASDEQPEQLVEGIGYLKDFDPYSINGRPNCAGVYVFYDISKRAGYVGRANNIAARCVQHQDKFWFKKPIVDNASYVQVANPILRNQLEQILIKFLKSNAVLNIQGVDWGEDGD